jgi:iron complex outermembrane receptor protein
MLTKHPLHRAVLLAVGALAGAAHAQTTTLERAEITGSSLRRVDAETALPVTVIKAEDLVRQGVTSAEQAIQRVTASQSTVPTARGIGSNTGGQATADLRGLGSVVDGDSGRRTLVLLNGRRVANHAYDSGSVDLNAIPMAAIDRIEVLRDGASAIYGTDAIGGVINFITRRDFRGIEVGAEYQAPQAAGGDTQRVSLAAGFGDLAKQGFNVMATFDLRQQERVASLERSFSRTGLRPDLGPAQTSGTTFPGTVNGFNPALAGGCAPPGSVLVNGVCRFDFPTAIDIVPDNDQFSALLRGTLKFGDHFATAEYLRAENKTVNRVAPTPLVGMTIPDASLPPGAPAATPNIVNWRAVPAGQRTNAVDAVGERALLELSGAVAGWDYKAGLMQSKSTVEDTFTDGYVNSAQVQAGLTAGIINPFGTQTPAGQAALDAAKIKAPVVSGDGKVTAIDAKVARDIAQLAAGPLALAVGAEHRREQFAFDVKPIAAQAASSGLELFTDVSGKRNVSALFAEIAWPLITTLEATLAARYDKYSDFGSSVNPKLALRWQPSRSFLARGSFNTGFRAPTLYDIYQPPALTNTSDSYDDPLLCPGGAPVPPAVATTVCDQQVNQRLSGPVGTGQPADTLQPEESRTISFGFVFEPAQSVTLSVDVWDIRLKEFINFVPEQAIFGDPVKYASRFVRCSQIPPAQQALIDVCINLPNFDPIAFIDTPTQNLGEVKTRGLDVGFGWRGGTTPYGAFTFSVDGTYVSKFEYQRERGGAFISSAGAYTDNAPVARWRHTAVLGWSAGRWSASVGQRWTSGYTDQTPTRDVRHYQVWDVSLGWKLANLTVHAGIRNLLDEEPPGSNQVTTFQYGYDPRTGDPLGRTYTLRVGYRF